MSKAPTYPSAVLGSSAIHAGTSLLNWASSAALLAQEFGYKKKMVTHQAETDLMYAKQMHQINESYHRAAGLPYVPGHAFGTSSIAHFGNNYSHRNMHTAGVRYAGSHAQNMTSIGNYY